MRRLLLPAALVSIALGACARSVIDREAGDGGDAAASVGSVGSSQPGVTVGSSAAGTPASTSGVGGGTTGGVTVGSSAATTSSIASSGAGGAPGVDTVIASGLIVPLELVLVDDQVYFTQDADASVGAVARVPKLGGAVETVSANQSYPWGLIAHGDSLGWTAYSEGGGPGRDVERFTVSSATTETLADGLENAATTTFHGDAIVFTTGVGSHILAARPDDTIEALGDFGPPFSALSTMASDGSRLFYAVRDGRGYFLSTIFARSDDGTLETLYTGINDPTAIVVDGSDLFFATTDGIIRRGSTSGAPETVLVTDSDMVGAMAVDATYVYFERSPAGEIARVPRSGGAIEVRASGLPDISGLAVDDDALYWADPMAGEIHRMLK